MSDSEFFGDHSNGLGTLILSIFNVVNIKVAFLLFLVLIFVNTTIYIERVLSNFNGAVTPGNIVTGKGSVIMSMMICIVYIVIDILVSQDVI